MKGHHWIDIPGLGMRKVSFETYANVAVNEVSVSWRELPTDYEIKRAFGRWDNSRLGYVLEPHPNELLDIVVATREGWA